ncbi:hypothetical protein GN244_ATG01686 [Phytophthora infestans]|uniref:OTU domain-containing protein n=1 Tax=Phytophthora infestans TaxID=4787 RepID=A0A833T1P2_PHYIN|nr:hypothetical protein GN244_ATG01686 [Phytophthora infestans]
MKFPSPYTTSVDGKCFYKAINIACLVVGARFLVHLSLIKEFEDIQEAKGQKEEYSNVAGRTLQRRTAEFVTAHFTSPWTLALGSIYNEGLEGEERHVQDECFLRSHMGKKLRARVWSYKDSGLDEEDGDEVELLELCVHATGEEICAAPDSLLLKTR